MSKQLRLPTLLVISDNASVRFWVKKHLDEKFFIIQATTKGEALAAFNARLDFIIIDSGVEEGEVFAICKEMSQFTNGLVPILLITGRLKKSFRDQAVKAGVTDFLSDQLDPEELEMRIESGKKANLSRLKTEDLSAKIKVPKIAVSSSYLKSKFFLKEEAKNLLQKAREEKTAVGFLFVRIDGFAELTKGEEVLTSFRDFIKVNTRKNDLLLFASEGNSILLLPHTKREEAKAIGEKLRKSVEAHLFGSLSLTASIAYAELIPEEKEFHRLFEAALTALKQVPKNQVISLA